MGFVTRLACMFIVLLTVVAHADQPAAPQRVALESKPSVVRVWGAYIATYEINGEKVQEAIGGTGTGSRSSRSASQAAGATPRSSRCATATSSSSASRTCLSLQIHLGS